MTTPMDPQQKELPCLVESLEGTEGTMKYADNNERAFSEATIHATVDMES